MGLFLVRSGFFSRARFLRLAAIQAPEFPYFGGRRCFAGGSKADRRWAAGPQVVAGGSQVARMLIFSILPFGKNDPKTKKRNLRKKTTPASPPRGSEVGGTLRDAP